MTSKEYLYRGAAIKQQIKELEEEYAFIESDIEKAIITLGGGVNKVTVGELGNYSLVGRKNWTFTTGLQAKKIDIKTLEDTEKATGAATFVEVFSPKFVPVKKD